MEDGGCEKENSEIILKDFRNSIVFGGTNYHVQLPWKEGFSGIHDNYSLSRGRLFSLLARLRKKPDVLEEYDNIIRNQMEEGIVEEVDVNKLYSA